MRLPKKRSLTAFVRATLALARTEVLFRIRGRAAVAQATNRAMRHQAGSADEVERRLQQVRVDRQGLRRAERFWPFPVHCLQRSLALNELLKGDRIPSQVVVGVRMDGSDLRSHAWVRVGRYVLDESHARHEFTPLDRLTDTDTALF